MTKSNFFESLKKADLTMSGKLEVCQFFLENFPINWDSRKLLENYLYLDIKPNGGSYEKINKAFSTLSSTYDKLYAFGYKDD